MGDGDGQEGFLKSRREKSRFCSGLAVRGIVSNSVLYLNLFDSLPTLLDFVEHRNMFTPLPSVFQFSKCLRTQSSRRRLGSN